MLPTRAKGSHVTAEGAQPLSTRLRSSPGVSTGPAPPHVWLWNRLLATGRPGSASRGRVGAACPHSGAQGQALGPQRAQEHIPTPERWLWAGRTAALRHLPPSARTPAGDRTAGVFTGNQCNYNFPHHKNEPVAKFRPLQRHFDRSCAEGMSRFMARPSAPVWPLRLHLGESGHLSCTSPSGSQGNRPRAPLGADRALAPTGALGPAGRLRPRGMSAHGGECGGLRAQPALRRLQCSVGGTPRPALRSEGQLRCPVPPEHSRRGEGRTVPQSAGGACQEHRPPPTRIAWTLVRAGRVRAPHRGWAAGSRSADAHPHHSVRLLWPGPAGRGLKLRTDFCASRSLAASGKLFTTLVSEQLSFHTPPDLHHLRDLSSSQTAGE